MSNSTGFGRINNRRRIKVKQGRYRHYKRNEYIVIGVARHSATDEELVVYRPDYGEQGLWVRPKDMFLESVEVDGRQILGFEYVEPHEND
jgi:hypothetical protein